MEGMEPAYPFAQLPESVRAAAIAIAAEVIGAVPPASLPRTVRPLARFAANKRARGGAAPLSRALEADAAFRAVIAEGLSAAAGRVLGAGLSPAARAEDADPAFRAARAYLLRLPELPEALAAAERADERNALREQVARLTAVVESLTARLASGVVADGGESAAVEPIDDDAARAEITKLRGRLREQGSRHQAALREVQEALAAAVAERDEARRAAERDRAAVAGLRARVEEQAHRAESAQAALERVRDEASAARADSDRRIALLLDTVVDAAAGLRREWRLATDGADPADVVTRGYGGVDPRPRRQVDGPLLLQWLTLPGAHLIIDGYNVTKLGYPDLSLSEQRDRLIRAVAAVVARTGVEATIVFDGAAVVAPPTFSRDVRVVFSPAGVIADDVIRRLAAAEPVGRVVVVVTADREVIEGVRRSGARTAPSAVLLQLIG